MDFSKIIIYEEEIADLYELIDRVSEYFELINFDKDSKDEDIEEPLKKSSPKMSGKQFRERFKSKKPAPPKLINFSTKAIGAKEAYKDFLRKKANDFSKIETDYYHIKE